MKTPFIPKLILLFILFFLYSAAKIRKIFVISKFLVSYFVWYYLLLIYTKKELKHC